jgi:excisionase family DNA binding protein|tara:strand:+ start:1778 stop:2089 length:312 start_codon:yes stop_codon:yes gene_type:complete
MDKTNINNDDAFVSRILTGVEKIVTTKIDEALNEGLIDEKPMTSADLMRWLNISKATLQRRVDNREIPFHRAKGKRTRLYFYKSEINQYFKENSSKTRTDLGL